MSIFVSWSGERSHRAALGLKSFLEDLFLQSVSVFVSDAIDPGQLWMERLSVELDRSQFGVVCLTAENFQAPWLMFEAGAIVKRFGAARVVPYWIDAAPETASRSPLMQFQHVRADRDGTFRLAREINGARENALEPDRLRRSFERWWPDLEMTLLGLPEAPIAGQPLPEREILNQLMRKMDLLLQYAQIGARGSISNEEILHLQNLKFDPELSYQLNTRLQRELRHLRDLGYIRNAQPIAALPKEFRLGEFFTLTEQGKNFIEGKG